MFINIINKLYIFYLNINLKNILKFALVRPGVSKHDLLEEPGAGACHIIFREFRYLSMHILLGMIR